jgi:hypothetical protein
MVYLGVHGTQPTAWAMYGPHVTSRSGQRVAILSPQPVAPAPEVVPAITPESFAEPVHFQAPITEAIEAERVESERQEATIEPSSEPDYREFEPVPYREPAVATLVQPAAPVMTAQSLVVDTFTHSDELVGELLNELAMMREELAYLREHVSAITEALTPR